MAAANRGARDVGALSIGLSIELPAEQEINAYVDLAIEFKHFYIRKIMFVRYALAFVVMPGGLGTLDELFEAHSLIQTAKIQQFPLVLVGSAFWSGLLDWERRQLVGSGKVTSRTLDLLHVVDDPEEVAGLVARVESPEQALGPFSGRDRLGSVRWSGPHRVAIRRPGQRGSLVTATTQVAEAADLADGTFRLG